MSDLRFRLARRGNWSSVSLSLIAVLFFVFSCSSEEQTADRGGAATNALPEISKLLPDGQIAKYARTGSSATYTRQDVWDYLGQQAEKYLMNGFAQMAIGKYRDGGDSLVIEVSQFGEKRNAYAVYSSDRKPGATVIEFDADGYLQEHNVHFTKDKFTVVIRGTGETPDETLIAAAKEIEPKIEGEPFVHPHARFLPAEGMIPHTMKISLMDNMPHNERPDLVSALYAIENDTMRVFLQYSSKLGMTFAAEEFLDDGGSVDEYIMGGEYQSLTGKSPEFGSIYCAVDGRHVCAVTGYTNLDHAKAMAKKLLEGLPKE